MSATVCFSCKKDKSLPDALQDKEVKLNETIKKVFQEPLSGEVLWTSLPDRIYEYEKLPLSGSIDEEGLNQVKARYQNKTKDEKYIDIGLTDGHGPMALAIKNTILLKLSKEFMETTADGYTKVYVRKGSKVYESQRNYNHTGSIEYMIDNRFCISIKGSNVNVKDLWEFADKLNYRELVKKL